MLLLDIWNWLIPSILIVVLIGIVIGTIIWFTNRTPDHLQGYYTTPFTIILIVLAILAIIGVVLAIVL